MTLLLAWVLLAAGGSPSEPELAARLAELDRTLVQRYPTLGAADLERLALGKLVRFRIAPTDQDPTDRAVALQVMDASREAIWISTIDPHFSVKSGLIERRLRSTSTGGALWMGLLDLPFPFTDRSWVVETRNNPTVVGASAGRAWERSWDLRPSDWSEVLAMADRGELQGPTRADLERSIVTPVNKGAWVIDDLGSGRCLVGYQAVTVVGGAVPTDVLTRFVVAGLDELFEGTLERARTVVPAHYVVGHEFIEGGDGRIIPHF